MPSKVLDVSPAASAAPSSAPQASGRLVSLDVLRGITIAFMILVNNHIRSYAYAPLEHSDWNGWTPTDIVFPTFLFIVGITIVFSFQSRLSRGASRMSLATHTFRRAAILFAIGIAIRVVGHIQGENMRIYGVLQRIAICFFIASIIFLLDHRPVTICVIAASALAGYWVLIRLVPIPGLGMPGRDFPLFDPTHNLGAYIDRHMFPGHLSRGDYDTEGLLGSVLPATATTLLGMLTALWLRSAWRPAIKAWGMLGAGILGIALGEFWSQWFPLNKKLWTSSYVLFSAGIALVLLAACYSLIDIKGWKKGWTYIWLVFGTNAIAVYVISEFLGPVMSWIRFPHGGNLHRSLANFFVTAIPSQHVASLAYSLTIVAICFVPAVIFYRKKIFIKI